ncbi:P-loop containing nucleoside triphosphate hydrolase protein [Gongronella butleri]|nr:P-loop containing nucleoside triphosphate hydrolase protein [Gongronella butleri]
MATKLPQTKAALDFILEHYRLYSKDNKQKRREPLVVGVSGCQGSGKTTLCATLVLKLQEAGYRVASLSLDDLYLTRVDQQRLADRHKQNPLLQQRGQPGSHDLGLARTTFASLLKGKPTALPVYDKSLHSGRGDRLPRDQWPVIADGLDILLFEGWSLGFKALTADEVRVARAASPLLQRYALEDLMAINHLLGQYQTDLYPAIDICLHLAPTSLDHVYQWRLEQEHYMKKTRGVDGLSDEAVHAFVDTYMPAYQMYLPRLENHGFFGVPDHLSRVDPYEGWHRRDHHYDNNQFARHLRFMLDKDRNVIATTPIFPPKRSAPVTPSNTAARWLRPSLYVLTTCTVGWIGWILFQKRQNTLQS